MLCKICQLLLLSYSGSIKHTGDYIDGNAAIYNSSQVALEVWINSILLNNKMIYKF